MSDFEKVKTLSDVTLAFIKDGHRDLLNLAARSFALPGPLPRGISGPKAVADYYERSANWVDMADKAAQSLVTIAQTSERAHAPAIANFLCKACTPDRPGHQAALALKQALAAQEKEAEAEQKRQSAGAFAEVRDHFTGRAVGAPGLA